MKIKLETILWENDFETIQEYTTAIKSCLDIDLDPKNIAPNLGKRAVAKICLNSLWGKFGQRQNITRTEYMPDAKRWYQLLLDNTLEISNTIFINNNMVRVTNMFRILFRLIFVLLHSQHLMRDCGCMICWTSSDIP